MAPSTLAVQSHGIFHGLPTFPDHDGKKYSAIVTGANGISGSHLVEILSKSPERWGKIFALSRKPPLTQNPNVHPIAVDFLSTEPEEIWARLATNLPPSDYIFFTSYIQPPPKEGQGLWSDEKRMEEQNVKLLSSFLSALELAAIIPKRFLLQTGAKTYGVHLGPTHTPMEESDSRVIIAPNFYYPQEDLLKEWCNKHQIHYNVTIPGYILGAVKGAAMNILYPLAVYASIQKELGNRLEFPADVAAWDSEKHQSMATLIAYHAEWAVLTEDAKDQSLNITDGSEFSWGKFWPVLAKWYGIKAGRPEEDESKYGTLEMPHSPPPRGFGPRGTIHAAWTFAGWSEKPEARKAWERLQARYGLSHNPFEDKQNTFGLLDTDVLGPWPRSISMDKSRKLGWNGFVDTRDAIRDTIVGLAGLKMVPPLPL